LSEQTRVGPNAILRHSKFKLCATGWRIAAGLVVPVVLVFLTRHQLRYWQNTVTLFEHAAAITADNPSAQFTLGVGLEKQGEVSKAMVRYRVAVAIDPNYSKAYYNIGQVLRKQAKWKEAANAYESALRWNSTDVPTLLNLAGVLRHLDRTPEAILHFEEALRLEPDSIEGLNNLAWLLSTSTESSVRDGPRAVQFAQRACALTEYKQPVFLGTLAAAYAEAGRFAEAVEAAQRACSVALQLGDSNVAARNQELLALYRAGKPFRESVILQIEN
jgi:tetratricopeptide (TPR) repeat protein